MSERTDGLTDNQKVLEIFTYAAGKQLINWVGVTALAGHNRLTHTSLYIHNQHEPETLNHGVLEFVRACIEGQPVEDVSYWLPTQEEHRVPRRI